MPSRRNDDDPSAPSIIAEGNDAEDPRTFEHDSADAVRNGELSAAQLSDGHGNVDPTNADAQYPPGVVQNTAPLPTPDDVRAMVPERRGNESTASGVRTTAATPDYGTNSEE